MNFDLARVFVKGHTTLVTILLNDLNDVECAMATPSAENIDPSGPSAASDEIKCVVMFYERGTSGNNFIRKENFRAVLNRNYKTLSRIRENARATCKCIALFFLERFDSFTLWSG